MSGAPPPRERVAVVLAAGQGKRMRSTLPKVLHEAAGRPLLAWVLDAARAAGCARLLVVVGHGAEAVRAAFPEPDVAWVLQEEQRGTGDALARAEAALGDSRATLLVLSGDVPLVSAPTLDALASCLAGPRPAWGAMAVADLAEPGSLGRVIAGPEGLLARIVEALAAGLVPHWTAMLADGGLLIADQPIETAGLEALPLPEGAPGRYFISRRVKR